MSTRSKKRGTAAPKPFNRGFSRRRLLTGLGAAGVLAPFLPMLEPEGRADAGDFPKRLILLFSANGTLHENWVPTGGEYDFELSTILAPLAAYRDQMIILDGLEVIRDGPGDGHQKGMGSLWTGSKLLASDEFAGGDGSSAGWCSHRSIDQEVANAVGNETPYKSLEFGVQTGGANVWSRMCYADSNAPIAPEDDPGAMFDRVFADLGVDTSALDRLKAERRSVIDLVKGDLQSLQSKMGAADRVKIEAHTDAIREIEKRNNLATPVCEQPVQDHELDPFANDNFPATTRQMIDQMVMALACDLTRVATLQWSRSVSNIRFRWLDIEEGHHSISHFGDSDPNMTDWITKINTWYAGEVAYLLERMSQIPEGEGTLLDNSIVVWGNELSRGNSHGNRPVPFVVFGGGQGAFETGRYLTYDRVEHNRLLVSLGQAMGLDLQGFGNNDPASGGLSGL